MAIRKRITNRRVREQMEEDGVPVEEYLDRVRDQLAQLPKDDIARNALEQVLDGRRAGDITGLPTIVVTSPIRR